MRKVLWILLYISGAVLAIILATVGLFLASLSLRSPPKTIHTATIISVERPVGLGGPLIAHIPLVDYMLVHGRALFAPTTQGIVGIVDTAQSYSVSSVNGLGVVHGVAIDPDDGLGFASDSDTNSVHVFELGSRRVVGDIPVDDDPDAIIYDEKLHLVYVATHDAGVGDIIDPASRKVTARIPLGGVAEYAQADPVTGFVYQNLMNTDEVVVVDPLKARVIARYKLETGVQPTGLAFDAAHRRLFVTGFGRKAVVLNAETGAVITAIPIGYGSDGIAYDQGLGRIYVANGFSATMTVIRQETADHYRVLEDAPTHFLGHSVVVDPDTHRIYVAFFGRIAVYEAASNATSDSAVNGS